MVIYVVTKDGVVMHITTDFDEAEAALLAGWGNGVEIYEVNTDDAVPEPDEGIKLTLREIREKLGQL